MPFPQITYLPNGNATVTIAGTTVNLGPLVGLEAGKTAILLRLLLAIAEELLETVPNTQKRATLKTLLGMLVNEL